MNSFTVICLNSEYANECSCTDTLIRTVEARNAFEASRIARRVVARETGATIRQPSDLRVIAVFPGRIRPALEARNFRKPT